MAILFATHGSAVYSKAAGPDQGGDRAAGGDGSDWSNEGLGRDGRGHGPGNNADSDPHILFRQIIDDADPNEFAGVVVDIGLECADFISWHTNQQAAAEAINLDPDLAAGVHDDTVAKVRYSAGAEQLYLGDEVIAEAVNLGRTDARYYIWNKQVTEDEYAEFVEYTEAYSASMPHMRGAEMVQSDSILAVPAHICSEARELIGAKIRQAIARAVTRADAADNAGSIVLDSGHAPLRGREGFMAVAPLQASGETMSWDDLLDVDTVLPHQRKDLSTELTTRTYFVGRTRIGEIEWHEGLERGNRYLIYCDDNETFRVNEQQFNSFLTEVQKQTQAALRGRRP